jgi:hypothetical protein
VDIIHYSNAWRHHPADWLRAAGYWKRGMPGAHEKYKGSPTSCDCLDRYLRGQDKALSVVAVPTEEQEEK